MITLSESEGFGTQKRDKLIVLPSLIDYNGDLTKKWYVEYQYFDHTKCGMRRFRYSKDINKYDTEEGRREAANRIIKKYRDRLLNGWNPFENESVIYTDSLEYQKVIETHGKLKKGAYSFKLACSMFLKTFEPPIRKKKTYQTYQSKLREFTRWLRNKDLLEKHPVHFKIETAKEFFDYLLIKKEMSNASFNAYRTLLLSLFDYIIEQGKLKKNPIANIKRLKKQRRMPRWYNEKMVKGITDHLASVDPQMLMVVKMIYYTYIRPGELRMLKVKHINFWDGTITIPKEVSKNGLEQKVTMPEVLVADIKELGWDKYPRDYYLFSVRYKPDLRSVGMNYFSGHYRKYMNDLGIPEEYELYSWKHTGAAVALKQGIDVESIRQQMRHSDLKVTQDYLEAMTAGQTSDFRKMHKPI